VCGHSSRGYDAAVAELPFRAAPDARLEEPPGSLEALAVDSPADVAARWPGCLAAWGALGEAALEAGRALDAYAYFRVGYHRGLDRLRAGGWRGAGPVPWAHEGNRGWLRSLGGLGAAAAELAEHDEADRCRAFLASVAPDAPAS
jgi:Protein of unknown function (DUF3151)